MLQYCIWQLCPLSPHFPEPANSHRPGLWWGHEICVLQPLAVLLCFPLQLGSQDMNLQMFLSQTRVQPRWSWTSLLAAWGSAWRLPCLLRGARGQSPSYDGLAAAKSLQSCPTLCDPIDRSPPGSPVPGILQARTLEWVAISFSNAGKWKVKVKSLSHVWPSATPWTAAYQVPPSMGFSRQ